jgi:DNA ligase D-like protein (predicted polymerase)
MADVEFTHLDEQLFDGADATKRDLVDYLDAVADPFVAVLRSRPLSVIRVRPGQDPFMQKNLPKYAPDWIARTTMWAESSRREVTYPLADDRRTLLWFANQRAVEFHPALVRADAPTTPTHLVIDLDPPEGGAFAMVVRVALAVREVLAGIGASGVVKTSGAKGLHVFVPLAPASHEDAAAATRALAARVERVDPEVATTAFIREDREGKVFVDATRSGGATVAAAYSPRIRPGLPVSMPVAWSDLDRIAPGDFTVRTAGPIIAASDPWSREMPEPTPLDAALVAEGHGIPVARVQAMHEGKRRAAQARKAASD